MASVTLYTTEGSKKGELDLDDRLFGVRISPALVHEAVVAQAANARVAIAHTKTRGEVSGSGKKPWKQKGTGRARHGSKRSPIWIGGGITFGPRKDRNFSLKINKKARRKALTMVLTDKVASNLFIAVDQFAIEDLKTKQLKAILEKLPLTGKKTLIITAPDNRTVIRAAQNLKDISTIPANTLNIIDLLTHQNVLITQTAVELITQIYNRD
jgi:large subunit ribosomal protein L4